ncbi:ankyrin repeat domain-containing protein [Oxalobacter sp. OttesenSCG-928-P03]|nr:ankyrin repeat domain-containing protein [Oxalobacter sp. OttesenSCG-928-P03]
MRHFFLSLPAAVVCFFLSFSAYAVTPLYDELGRLENGDEVYREYNPPKKGQENRPVPEIDRYDHMGRTALQSAAAYREIDKVRDLLAKKANPNIISAGRRTALQYAVSADHLEIAKLLLAHKADPNLGDTLSLSKSDEMTKLLKSHGARASRQKEKKDVHISLFSSKEARIISETIEQAKKNQPIPTLAQAVILDEGPENLDAMLKKGTDINEIDPVFGTALHQFFAQGRDKSVGIFLLEKGADPNLVSRAAHPFLMALGKGDLDIISLMIKKGADIRATDSDGREGLSRAAEKGRADVVKLLLDAGAKADAKDKDGQTALYYVLWRNPKAVDVARLLLEKGASTTVAPKTPALGVVSWRKDNLDMILLLLEYKARPVSGKDQETLLIWAVRMGSMPLLNAAVNAGVDIRARNEDGESALEVAVKVKRADMVQRLLATGAPVNGSVGEAGRIFIDTYGKMHQGTDDLLAKAVSGGDIDVIKTLVAAGVNLDTTANSFEKPAPLHIAVKEKRKDIVDILLAAGASPNSLNRYGRTPLHVAARYADTSIVQRLLAAGADPNLADKDGETPLDEAMRRKDTQIMDDLQNAGAQKGARKSR